jgi:hypothetical protein
MLLGPDEGIAPEWVSRLQHHVGTPDDWAALGLPITFDDRGYVAPLLLHVVVRDGDGPVALRGPELERAVMNGERVEARWSSFIVLSREDAEGLPRCTEAGVRAPW